MPSFESLVWGRRVTEKELEKLDLSADKLENIPAIQETEKGFECQRCGNTRTFYPNRCFCQTSCVYCLECVKYGVLRRCDRLYSLPAPETNVWRRTRSYLHFEGILSPSQLEVSHALLTSLHSHKDHLVWAVTGAGKTEMLFHVVDQALREGKRIGIATPCLDVANELFLRFVDVFPEIAIVLLHGKSEMAYQYTPIVICSTHQLVRFYQAFDLLVIDETDAFPFHDNSMLKRAVATSRKAESTLIYLTATPDQELRNLVRRGKITQSLVPARYHRKPLPVPRHCFDFKWEKRLKKGRLPKRFAYEFTRLVKAGHRFLVFLPTIESMLQLEKVLRKQYPNLSFEAVHAGDEHRIEKVYNMREASYQLLLTTTILERGVTFEAIDVIVLGSEDQVFTRAALVQIAGRAGRKARAPRGEVLFLNAGRTRASVQAVREIQRMNHLAETRGLLDGGPG